MTGVKKNSISFANQGIIDQYYKKFLRKDKDLNEDWVLFFNSIADGNVSNNHDTRADKPTRKNAACVHDKSALEIVMTKNPAISNCNPLHVNLGAINEFKARHGIDDSLNNEVAVSHFFGDISLDIAHIEEAKKDWFVKESLKVESLIVSSEDRIRSFKQLYFANKIDEYFQKLFPTKKRFSLKNMHSLPIILNGIINEYAISGRDPYPDITLGSSHRGRLEILTSVLDVPIEKIALFFQDQKEYIEKPEFDDVPFHLGFENKIFRGGKEINISLLSNPSHLESVFPVAMGYSFARQSGLTFVIHGDASFVGQGIVGESFNLGSIKNFKGRGVIHVVVNNQIGFTTESSPESVVCKISAVGRSFEIPIIHVNAEDIDSCHKVAKYAYDFVTEFGSDIIINFIGSRLYGHNELDSTEIFNPTFFKLAMSRTELSKKYSLQLESQGFSESEIGKIKNEIDQDIENRLTAKDYSDLSLRSNSSKESEDVLIKKYNRIELSCNFNKLFDVSKLNLHKMILNKVDRSKKYFQEGYVDWSVAEALALLCIADNNLSVRLTGEDVERGVFLERLLVVRDQNSGDSVNLINKARPKADIVIANSTLSEYAALGFEYGFSMSNRGLNIWEAQFGDFINESSVIVDEFIVSGNAKWGQKSNITVMLPSGNEGMGANHSSGMIERVLNDAVHNNIIVASPSTAANFYHLLINQSVSDKPCFIFSHKTYLKGDALNSPIERLTNGDFEAINLTKGCSIANAKRVIFSYGKMFLDLSSAVNELQVKDVCLIGLDQVYPFPESEIRDAMRGFKGDVVFAQEEPVNKGIIGSVKDYFINIFADKNNIEGNKIDHDGIRIEFAALSCCKFISRSRKSYSAGALPLNFKKEQQLIIDFCLNRK